MTSKTHVIPESSEVLLVDDEPGIRKVLGMTLEDMGYRVDTAENGREALVMFQKKAYWLVLTDIKMPEMDGIQLLQNIKAQRPDTEVIMITGHGDLDLAIRSLQLEAVDFISKPIRNDILEIALKRANERRSMRRQIREYTQNLEALVREKTQKLLEAERLAAVGQTVADLSHAIKNIAGGLSGGIFVLGKGIELNDQTYLRQGWEMIKGNVDKVKNLSLDLLGFAKSAHLQLRLTDPNAPAREAADLMRPKADAKGIFLQLKLSSLVKPVLMDPEGIHRCLLNLVTNALDACRECNSEKDARIIRIETEPFQDRGVLYRVQDNGCGMEASVKAKLFQRFFSTKGMEGTGIGLMISKKIIDDHHGTIEVESEQGVGSIFTLKIPGSLPESSQTSK